MDNEAPNADQLFGQAVVRARQARELSQRAFADKLTTAGMTVDASAVSRIEKGTRSVRLNEALTIADVLDVDLTELVDAAQTTRQIFARQRRHLDMAMKSFEGAGYELANALADIHFHIQTDPSVLEAARDERFSDPTDADSYLEWVAKRWRANTQVSGPELVVKSKEGASKLLHVLQAVTDGVVDAMDEEDDVEPEAAE